MSQGVRSPAAGVPDRAAVLVLDGAARSPAAPPGCDPGRLAVAMAEDVLAVIGDLDGVDEVIACSPDSAMLAEGIRWPTTTVLPMPAGSSAAAILALVADLGYRQGVLVAPDCPDLPALHLAKVFAALTSSPSAVSVSLTGGLVILGSQLPGPAGPGAVGSAAGLDGPAPAGARETLPWRRLRRPADLARLEPALEGWDSTRALLAGREPWV